MLLPRRRNTGCSGLTWSTVRKTRLAIARWIGRARILLGYCTNRSSYAEGEAMGVTHQTILRCPDRAVCLGVTAAFDDNPGPGQAPQITDEANAWLVGRLRPHGAARREKRMPPLQRRGRHRGRLFTPPDEAAAYHRAAVYHSSYFPPQCGDRRRSSRRSQRR